ncbi:molybdopterin molybdotransferase MoeA [Methylobacillus gramineus]|uniref:molybdopterin molybdotransferase MoeA n=1 Tax=Methylobacillus gramineus TaxID=755169 RepID=UPI001CFFBB36|nr:gephyrin-like molybdotransferase Glp [Methylobacillus gramineus]MCB5186177.1 molybdopterin molybdotransferase MoeA [Methylobacillus gramineus]
MTTKNLSDISCQDDYDPNSMPVTQARHFIRDYLTRLTATETLPLKQALGRILEGDILSPSNVPNHNNSAMDGYAFHSHDTAATALRIVGTAFAGKPFDGVVQAGECIRIMTGAVIPAGTDTVVMQEHTQTLNDQMVMTEVPKAGANVRHAGEDLQQGQIVLPQGRSLRPSDIGLIASLGIGEVTVYRKLRVAFFSTGDELVSIGQPLEEGEIYDSNRYTLHSMLSRLNIEILDMGVVADDPQLLEQTLLDASQQADVVITSGGVSVGEADFMKLLLEKLGQVVFWKIAMKPGRPLAYGKVGNAHYFGLPGNPVSVMVTFYQFVRDALLYMMGQTHLQVQPLLQMVCTEDIRKLPGRTEFQRGILYPDRNGIWRVRPTSNQGSGILRSMSEANCFIVLDEAVGNVQAGSTVNVQVLEGII